MRIFCVKTWVYYYKINIKNIRINCKKIRDIFKVFDVAIQEYLMIFNSL